MLQFTVCAKAVGVFWESASWSTCHCERQVQHESERHPPCHCFQTKKRFSSKPALGHCYSCILYQSVASMSNIWFIDSYHNTFILKQVCWEQVHLNFRCWLMVAMFMGHTPHQREQSTVGTLSTKCSAHQQSFVLDLFGWIWRQLWRLASGKSNRGKKHLKGWWNKTLTVDYLIDENLPCKTVLTTTLTSRSNSDSQQQW